MKLTNRVRIASIVTGGFMLLSQFAAPVSAAAHPNDNNNRNDDYVTICHATGSNKHPYQQITPDKDGVVNGHLGAGHQNGEDIVPPFTFNGQTYSQNWDQASQDIWNNKCKVPGETDTTALTIVKDAQGDPTQAFDFTLAKENDQDNKDFSLKNGESKSYDLKSGKTYTVSEAATAGWDLTKIVCNDEDDITVDLANHQVTVELDDEEDITCTFTNVQQEEPEAPATLTIKKVLQSDNGSSQDFTFSSDELGSFQLDADQSSNTLPNKQTFSGLSAGTYGVREQTIWGWHLEEITCDGTNDYTVYEGRVQVNLQPGDNVTCTFLNEQMNALGGFKFNDLNGNGKWDADEPAIEGWTMTITGGEDNITESIQTNSDGFYTFTGLEDGIYKICEEQRAGWTQTFPATDDGCYTVMDLNEHNGVEKNGFDFGNTQPAVVRTATIKGAKFNDANGNGVWDNNEHTLPGWTITLYDGNGTTLAGAQTDQNGAYSFTDLDPGDYKVCETQKANWTRTMPATSDCYTIALASGQTFTANFGNHAKPQVLGESTTATLVNTGGSIGANIVVSMFILAAAGAATLLTGRRKDYTQ